MSSKYSLTSLLVFFAFWSNAQQVQDPNFDPDIKKPAYAKNSGSLVRIDEAHHNFHTIETRYLAFSKVLKKDGYKVEPNKSSFSTQSLKGTKILVIANAVHVSDTSEWVLPNPSAFTKAEIESVKQWVNAGGSLFLIADHMPFPGAAGDLGKAFGFQFNNGFATDTTSGNDPGKKKELDLFTKQSGSLAQHPITKGIDHVGTFTGQAFQIPKGAVSLLTFDHKYISLQPDTAWKFNTSTKRTSVKGYSQGAVLNFGKGRVAVFGEAAEFTAQLKGKEQKPFGLNSPDADQNVQFLLNLIHWLDFKY